MTAPTFAERFGVEAHGGGDRCRWGDHPVVDEPALRGRVGVAVRPDVVVAPGAYADMHRRQCGCGRWGTCEAAK